MASTTENQAKNDEKGGPSRWWQWVLLYPTLLIALLTAVPSWYDRIEPLVRMKFQPDYVQETELVEFMRKNPECVASPVAWVEATDQTKVDGTICSKTGDVWLRILGANGVAAYKGVDISDLLDSLSTDHARFSLFSARAFAATNDRGGHPKTHPGQTPSSWSVAQQLAVVVCQQFSGDRIIRHMRSGNTCYEEVVNSQNGVVISKQEVPCRNSC